MSRHGKYKSKKTGIVEKYDSTYELRRFQSLDASPLVKKWTKDHHLRIPYKMLGKKHRYNPDILVFYHDGRTFLEEVKGKIWNKMQFILKNMNAQSYCFEHKITFRVIYEADLSNVI